MIHVSWPLLTYAVQHMTDYRIFPVLLISSVGMISEKLLHYNFFSMIETTSFYKLKILCLFKKKLYLFSINECTITEIKKWRLKNL